MLIGGCMKNNVRPESTKDLAHSFAIANVSYQSIKLCFWEFPANLSFDLKQVVL